MLYLSQGWLGGAMKLGKLPVLGRPANLDNSRARAYCPCSRCGWGLFGHFFSRLLFLSSFSLSLGDGPILTEILSERAFKPKTTNQPNLSLTLPASVDIKHISYTKIDHSGVQYLLHCWSFMQTAVPALK